MDFQLLVDILGWVGGITLLIAFGANSFGKIEAQSNTYQLLNLGAAVGLIVNTAYYGAWPATFVNVVWVLIALFSMIAIYRKKRLK